MDRLSLDLLFCDPMPDLMQVVRNNCLPSQKTMKCLENADAFESAIALKDSFKPSPLTTSE